MRLARVLGGIGRTMITAGVLILLFVAYQLWGTGIRERQAQDRLGKQLDAQLSTTTTLTTVTAPPGTLPVTTAPPLDVAPNEGEPIGRIEIPRIGLKAVVIEGVGVDDLKDGPGHYPDTPMPGQKGNSAVAGHRTTYGAPFASVDELAAGDDIIVTTLQGRFTYSVTASEIVSPNQVDVLDDKGDNRITLTACHPKYSASQRIIISGVLKGEPLPATAAPRPGRTVAGVSGEQVPKLPAILWALACAAIWLTAWLVGKRWRKWPPYILGLPVFLVALFFFFENFSRLLPANY
jgi:sortase A